MNNSANIIYAELLSRGFNTSLAREIIGSVEGLVHEKFTKWYAKNPNTPNPQLVKLQIWRSLINAEVKQRKELEATRPTLLDPHGQIISRRVASSSLPAARTAITSAANTRTAASTATASAIDIRTISLLSNYRNHLVNPSPNEFEVALNNEEMINHCTKIILRYFHVPAAFESYTSPRHSIIYLRLDNVSTSSTVQKDEIGQKTHFKCHSRLDYDTNYPIISIDTSTISFASPVKLDNVLKISITNAQKLPLLMEQDVYTITLATLDVINGRTIFDIGEHSLNGGDPIILRGLTIDADRELYSDRKDLRAIIISATQIAVSEYVASGTFEYNNPRVISKERCVQIDLEFQYLYAARTAVGITSD